MTCHHPLMERRTYRVGEAVAQVCYSCFSVRTTDEGYWWSVCRIYDDGDLYTIGGVLWVPDYFRARSRALAHTKEEP